MRQHGRTPGGTETGGPFLFRAFVGLVQKLTAKGVAIIWRRSNATAALEAVVAPPRATPAQA